MIEIEKIGNPGEGGWFSRHLSILLDKIGKAHAKYQRKFRIRPSEIGECTRKIVYDILNFPSVDVPDPKLQRVFQNGTKVHERYLRQYIPKMGIACKIYTKKRGKWGWYDFIEEMLEDRDLWLRGAPDAVIVNPETGEQCVFELKSIKQEYFWKLTDALPDHVYQAHLYMYMTGIKKALIVYENKNNQDTREFPVDFDPKIMKFLLKKIRKIQKYVWNYMKTKQLPDREYDKDTCKNCKFALYPTGCLCDGNLTGA